MNLKVFFQPLIGDCVLQKFLTSVLNFTSFLQEVKLKIKNHNYLITSIILLYYSLKRFENIYGCHPPPPSIFHIISM